jgi:N-hydroxyarylamine O-acetyltransferase
MSTLGMDVDLEAYRRRVGLASLPPATPAGLRALHEAHVSAIPFENLDVLQGRPIALDLASLQAKLVAARRGGYCFEQNTLFAAVLERLGFRVTRLAARVLSGTTEVRARTHLLLQVAFDDGEMIADVGFGGEGLVHPLALRHGRETYLGGLGYRLREEPKGTWVLQGNLTGEWSPFYAFTREPQDPADYEMANHFTSTFPRSPFLLNLTVQRSWPDRRLILRNRELLLREGRTVRASAVRDPEHLLEVLREQFGLSFAAGTRFPKPEF